MEALNMKLRVERIKTTMRWFPGLVLGLGRQVGKTSALLEMIHDDHNGQGTVYAMNQSMALYAKQMYKDKYPDEPVPNFVSQTEKVRGRSDPIFVDDWWNIPTEDRRNLIGNGRLAARIGTEFGQRNLDSTVVRFTDAELDYLEKLISAVHGGHGLPWDSETMSTLEGLRIKFRREKDEV
jgi:hypothetical protein